MPGSSSIQQLKSRVARALVRRCSACIPDSAAGWPALHAELDRWRGEPARFWWRDDDAISVTPELRGLMAVRDAYEVPVAIAVIASDAAASLASALRASRGISVVAHGWNHQDHSVPGQPRGELTSGRDLAEVVHELSTGRARLEDMFGDRFKPVLVPPHNHFAPQLAASVQEAGFSFVSIDGDFDGLPIPSRNVHIDVIDWGRKQATTQTALVRSAIAALRLRRFGLVRADSPIGLLTHHLAQDARAWEMTRYLLKCLKQHPAATFPEIHDIFR